QIGLSRALTCAHVRSSATHPGMLRRADRYGLGLLRPSQDPVPADAQRVGRDAEIDDDRLADDVRPRQEAPETAVVGLVAVVAHHEEMPRGQHDRTPDRKSTRLNSSHEW